MITIRRAEIKDVAYIAEGIFNAFLLEDNAIVLENRMGEGSIHHGWMPGHPTLYLKKEI